MVEIPSRTLKWFERYSRARRGGDFTKSSVQVLINFFYFSFYYVLIRFRTARKKVSSVKFFVKVIYGFNSIGAVFVVEIQV